MGHRWIRFEGLCLSGLLDTASWLCRTLVLVRALLMSGSCRLDGFQRYEHLVSGPAVVDQIGNSTEFGADASSASLWAVLPLSMSSDLSESNLLDQA